MSDTYNYLPKYYTLFKGNEIVSIIPVMEIDNGLTSKKGVSLPFSDYCNFLGKSEDQIKKVLVYTIQSGSENGWKYLKLSDNTLSIDNLHIYKTFFIDEISLNKSESELFKSFNKNTHRAIKSSESQGVKIIFSYSLSSIKEFYRLHCITRKRHGIPPQPFKFFESIWRNIISKKQGFISSAYVNNIIVASNIYFNFGNTAIYKYGASDLKYSNLRANFLIMWESIKYLNGRGITKLSLGKTNSENKGLLQFKSGWGTKRVNAYSLRLFFNEKPHQSSQVSFKPFYPVILKKLPLPILKLIGKLLYKYMA
jgi:hypothetical protein